jgi:hypothetical protein
MVILFHSEPENHNMGIFVITVTSRCDILGHAIELPEKFTYTFDDCIATIFVAVLFM